MTKSDMDVKFYVKFHVRFRNFESRTKRRPWEILADEKGKSYLEKSHMQYFCWQSKKNSEIGGNASLSQGDGRPCILALEFDLNWRFYRFFIKWKRISQFSLNLNVFYLYLEIKLLCSRSVLLYAIYILFDQGWAGSAL